MKIFQNMEEDISPNPYPIFLISGALGAAVLVLLFMRVLDYFKFMSMSLLSLLTLSPVVSASGSVFIQ